ncbi:cytochrome P450 [Kibdelosporangium phytohabitans]|uniref:Cytochrome n=1 Tax=Kibdelosporangium phytohabitans TaxID=860235 RepID=A0A0N9I810_9PSEU|nr:cytochrome P450 [Kibdelosporangium phytohabitans]ALG10653.1 cytochrome [Kibdelosporangium phytohabitans]MBE1461773.1 cytochrome P450 [Kibdelosporangium phytohabitans]
MSTLADTWGIHDQQFWLRGHVPEDPVEYKEEQGTWHVYGYQEAVHVLSDTAVFSSHTNRKVPDTEEGTEGNLLQLDPPEHRKLRNLVSHAFTPKVVANLEPRIAELTHELLDAAAGRDHLELVNDLAYPLPVIVIAELLGVPSSDRELFKNWVDGMFENTQEFSLKENSADQESARKATLEETENFKRYLGEHAADRRRNPREDLLGKLVEAEVDGERLTDTQIVNFAMVLLIAGHITTTMLLGNTIVCLDNHPEQMARVRADRALVPSAIEESLRYFTPFTALARITDSEVSLAGHTIPEDEMLLIWIGAANRDPRQFTDPGTYDIGRDPNPHMAFGRGIHFCVGAPLARLEGRVALNILLDRYPTLHTDPQKPAEFLPSPYMAGVRSLPMFT